MKIARFRVGGGEAAPGFIVVEGVVPVIRIGLQANCESALATWDSAALDGIRAT